MGKQLPRDAGSSWQLGEKLRRAGDERSCLGILEGRRVGGCAVSSGCGVFASDYHHKRALPAGEGMQETAAISNNNNNTTQGMVVAVFTSRHYCNNN